MEYKKIFDPNNKVASTKTTSKIESLGDRSSKSVYVFNDKIILAVNVAIATGRPLLVRGPSGWGKSSLAKSVADILGWRYYEKVISSRTQSRDLLWEVDMLRRLQDAQIGKLEGFTQYIKPGVLWRAFNFKSALIQEVKALSPTNLKIFEERNCSSNYPQNHSQAVVLLDEIDKADPDLPNNLLVPLGSLYFTVEETGTKVKCEEPPLVIITTNNERELPPAFLRRCVELNLNLELSKPDLLEIVKAHFEEEHLDLIEKVAILLNVKESKPSPAEFIDTVKACINLNINPESKVWDDLKETTVWKHGRKERG